MISTLNFDMTDLRDGVDTYTYMYSVDVFLNKNSKAIILIL